MSSTPSATQDPGMADPMMDSQANNCTGDNAPVPVTTREHTSDMFDQNFTSNEPHTPIADKYATPNAADGGEAAGSAGAANRPVMPTASDGDDFEFSRPRSLEFNPTPRASMRVSSASVSPELVGAMVPVKSQRRFPYKESFEKSPPSSSSSSDQYHDAAIVCNEGDETKWQQCRKWYLSIIVALGIICVGTLIPLIYLIVHRDKCSAEYNALKVRHSDAFPTIAAAAFGAATDEGAVFAAGEGAPPFGLLDPAVEAIMSNNTLHRTFHGLDYLPTGIADCSVSPLEVALDVAVISQVANNVRLYSSECDQAGMVLSAITSLQLDLGVTLGIKISEDSATMAKYINDTMQVLDQYDPSLVGGIMVGPKALERGETSEEILIHYIKLVKQELSSQNMNVLVGTSQTLEKWSPSLVKAVDILDVNVYSFYAGEPSESAADWTKSELVDETFELLGNLSSKLVVFSEMGWPSTGGDVAQAVADHGNAQTFMKNWVCSVVPNLKPNIEWYYAQAFDNASQFVSEDGQREWESHWGVFDASRNLKYPLPNCNSEVSDSSY